MDDGLIAGMLNTFDFTGVFAGFKEQAMQSTRYKTN
jgi:hypothetical protein